jgi:hypothetical protein
MDMVSNPGLIYLSEGYDARLKPILFGDIWGRVTGFGIINF